MYRIYSLIICMWKLKTIFWMRWNHWSFIFHLLADDCVLLVSRFFEYLNHMLACERFWPLLISFAGDMEMCLISTFKVLRNPFTILQGFFLQIFFQFLYILTCKSKKWILLMFYKYTFLITRNSLISVIIYTASIHILNLNP